MIFCGGAQRVVSRRVFLWPFALPTKCFGQTSQIRVGARPSQISSHRVFDCRVRLFSQSTIGSFLRCRGVSTSFEGYCKAKLSRCFRTTPQLCLTFGIGGGGGGGVLASPQRGGSTDPLLGGASEYLYSPSVCSGTEQCGHGRSISSQSGDRGRVDSASRGFRYTSQEMAGGDRSLCVPQSPLWCLFCTHVEFHDTSGVREIEVLTLIAPFWPQQEWFPDLVELLLEPPLPLPSRWYLLRQLHIRRFHQNLHVLHLHAWRLSSTSPEPPASLQKWLDDLTVQGNHLL